MEFGLVQPGINLPLNLNNFIGMTGQTCFVKVSVAELLLKDWFCSISPVAIFPDRV